MPAFTIRFRVARCSSGCALGSFRRELFIYFHNTKLEKDD
jgi:hypothetical protein